MAMTDLPPKTGPGRGIFLAGALLAVLLAGCPAEPGKVSDTLTGGEAGRIHYQSTSPYDFGHILDDGGRAERVAVFGDLELPGGAEGKVPAMVFVHGSGGWSPKHERYLEEFHRMGIATFRTDSFRPRGVASTVGEQVSVSEAMMVSDAFHALRLLATHPRIDPGRIGIMGSSKGGGVALYTAWEPLRRAAAGGDLKFALHLPLYPPCGMFSPLRFTGAPIMILSGELDEWTPAAPCVELTNALRAEGYRAEIIVYPGAYHSFDSEWPLRRVDRAFNITKCRFAVGPDGKTIEKTSGLALDSPESRRMALSKCAARGVLAGRNESARKKALEDVKAFVRRVFGPPGGRRP
ncbi:dienelactone hydrolase family protein [Nitrospinota bacterium]